MSSSPNKFVRAAASVAGGRGGGSRALDAMTSIPAFERILGLKKNRRAERAKRAQALADYKKRAAMSGRQRMRAQSIQAAGATAESMSNIDTNNTIDNTVADAQDRSQMRAEGALTSTEAPVGFSTMSSVVLDPISRQPMGGVQPVPNVQEQTIPEDVATYGVAGAAQSMFGTPMQRQISMGSSLMKRACKYKNKK